MDLTEPLIDAALASLRASLPTYLAAVNQAHSDFEVPTPEDDCFSDGTTDVVKEPWIEVATADFTLANFTLSFVDADLTTTLIVKATLTEPNTSRLYRQAMRMTGAIVDVLIQPGALGEFVLREEFPIRGRYAVNPETNERQEFQASALLFFEVEAAARRTV